MAADKSIELFLEISPPELKTLRLSRGLFHLPIPLNNFIHSPTFCKSLKEVDHGCRKGGSAER
jgi:hypothetical protein